MESHPPEFTQLDQTRLACDASQLATDEGVLNMLEYARDVQSDAEESARATLAIELSLSQALVACGAWFALALHANQGNQRLFPRDWLEPEGHGNPDVIMSCVLCQLTNYSHSVIELVTRGLDTPARALLRSTADLSYMLAVLTADRETFKAYVLDKSSLPKDHWYKLFSNRKIATRISRIDAKFGLPQEWTNYMRQFREGNNEFFSEAVHHSPTAILVGALPRTPGTDQVELALFGGAPSASSATLGYLATSLNYGLTMFVETCERGEEFIPKFSQPQFWEAGVAIYRRVQPVFISWLQEQERVNNRMHTGA